MDGCVSTDRVYTYVCSMKWAPLRSVFFLETTPNNTILLCHTVVGPPALYPFGRSVHAAHMRQIGKKYGLQRETERRGGGGQGKSEEEYMYTTNFLMDYNVNALRRAMAAALFRSNFARPPYLYVAASSSSCLCFASTQSSGRVYCIARCVSNRICKKNRVESGAQTRQSPKKWRRPMRRKTKRRRWYGGHKKWINRRFFWTWTRRLLRRNRISTHTPMQAQHKSL